MYTKYKVLIMVDGDWVELARSPSFSDSWDYARGLRYTHPKSKIKVVGPEGEWPFASGK